MATVRDLHDVDIIATGTFGASTGRATVTRDDLVDILRAHADDLVDRAPLKIGHESKFNDDEGIGEGNPAFGWVIPERIDDRDDGTSVLVGSIKGVPRKLADVLPHAYRRRSAELMYGVKTSAGRKYRAVLTGLAVLGATPPAVKTLRDVLAYYSGDDVTGDPVTVHLSDPTGGTADDTTPDTGAIPHETPAPGDDDTDSTDPTRKDHPVTIPDIIKALSDAPEDADPVKVLTDLLAKAKDEAEGKPDAALSDDAPTPAEETAARTNPADVKPAGANAAEKTGIAQTAEQAAAEGERPAAGTVTLSADTYRQLLADAETAKAKRAEDMVEAAFAAGKITATEKPVYLSAAVESPTMTARILDGLASRFSTTERGHDNAPETTPNDPAAAALDAWEAAR